MKDAKKFTGDENHAITAAEALTFIKQFREHYGPEAAPGVFFDKQVVQAILNQPEAVGMRYYYGTDMFGETRLVLVGTDANRNDLLEGEPVKASVLHPPLTARGVYNQAGVSHEISLNEAAELTARYQETLEGGQPKGGFFGKKAIEELLNYPECVGLRCFFGANKEGTRVMMALCVDKFGVDMFYGPMLDLSKPCPPICGKINMLNNGSIVQARLAEGFSGVNE